jgi:hypothetical protein
MPARLMPVAPGQGASAFLVLLRGIFIFMRKLYKLKRNQGEET